MPAYRLRTCCLTYLQFTITVRTGRSALHSGVYSCNGMCSPHTTDNMWPWDLRPCYGMCSPHTTDNMWPWDLRPCYGMCSPHTTDNHPARSTSKCSRRDASRFRLRVVDRVGCKYRLRLGSELLLGCVVDRLGLGSELRPQHRSRGPLPNPNNRTPEHCSQLLGDPLAQGQRGWVGLGPPSTGTKGLGWVRTP